MRNAGDRLKIVLGNYWVSYEKNGLWFAYSDWSHVEFRHDCEKKQFVLDFVKLGGI